MSEGQGQLAFGFPGGNAPAAGRVPPRSERLAKAGLLARRLSNSLGVDVRLAVTDNRSTMVSFQERDAALAVRVHHMFLDAPEPVVLAIADYAGRRKREAAPVLDEYIRVQGERIRKERAPGQTAPCPVGRYFHLGEVFDRLNGAYFQGAVRARIGWGRRLRRRRRRTIRLGVYDHGLGEIRIHPSLDNPLVPLFFLEYIVFHEMLHELFPTASSGRHQHHPRAFRERERTFPRYREALDWEKKNLRLLLR